MKMPSGASVFMLRFRWPSYNTHIIQGLLIGFVCALLMRGALLFDNVLDIRPLERLEQNALDILFRSRGPLYPAPQIVLVVADDATVTRSARWPLPRELYARVIRRLHRAKVKVIGLDVLLSTPSYIPSGDLDLIRACRDAGNVVQAAAFYTPSTYNPEMPVITSANYYPLPQRFAVTDRGASSRNAVWASSTFPALEDTAPLLGHINVHPETDGVLRRIPHLLRYRDTVYPSLALATAAFYFERNAADIVAGPAHISLANHQIPVDTDGEAWINWVGANTSFPTYTFNDILSDRVPDNWLKDRIVLIGITAAGAYEYRATPFSPLQPAVEMQASALDNILLNRTLREAPWWWRELLLFGFAMLIGILVAPRRAGTGSVIFLLLAFALWRVGVALLAYQYIYLPLATPLLAGVLTYSAATAFNYRRVWQQNWRAEASLATLVRGGELMSSGHDRARLHQVILQTASDALGAWAVFLVRSNVVVGTVDEVLPEAALRQVSYSVTDSGRPVLWPATAPSWVTRMESGAGRLIERVLLVEREATGSAQRNRNGDDAIDRLSREFRLLCDELAGCDGTTSHDSRHNGLPADAEDGDSIDTDDAAVKEPDVPAGEPQTAVPAKPKRLREAPVPTVVAVPLPNVSIPGAEPGAFIRENTGVLIAVGRRDGSAFMPRDAILLEMLAEQAALALNNLEYYEQLQGRIEATNRDLERAYSLLTEQSVKLFAAIESIDDALIIVDENQRAVYVNGSCHQILGAATPHLGQDVPARLRLERLDPLAALFEEMPQYNLHVVPAQQKFQAEVVREAESDGETALLHAVLHGQLTPLSDETGYVLGAMLLVSDVTVQRELDTMKNDFVGFVAHELRTPLTTILGYASLLQGAGDKIPPPQRGEMTGAIIHHCRRLNRMIGELLDVSRLEAGKPIQLRLLPVDLVEVCQRVIQDYKTASSRAHTLLDDLQTSRQPLYANVDEDRFEQIVTNLVSNALKYSPDGGVVTVRLDVEHSHAILRVADTGMGMTTEQLSHLFERFYRTPDAQARGIKGTGLGLFLVKQLVEAHGGQISVESTAGQGTTFIVQLPLQVAAEEE